MLAGKLHTEKGIQKHEDKRSWGAFKSPLVFFLLPRIAEAGAGFTDASLEACSFFLLKYHIWSYIFEEEGDFKTGCGKISGVKRYSYSGRRQRT